ncbi:MAG: sigma factor-like helix-turn-helix DNA-binding protein [Vulcanimicrobiota bacterium]
MKSGTKKEKRFDDDKAMEYIDSLYRTASRLCADEQEAQRLLKHTYLKTFRYSHLFNKESSVKECLFKTLVRIHSKKKTHDSGGEIPRKPEDFSIYNRLKDEYGMEITETVGARLLSRFKECEIKKCIEDLPDDYKIPIVLADIESLGYYEIAYILNLPLSAVREKLKKGRKLLQGNLWSYVEEKLRNDHIDNLLKTFTRDKVISDFNRSKQEQKVLVGCN